MALKSLYLGRKVQAKAAELEELEKKDAVFAEQKATLTAAFEEASEASTAEELKFIEDEIDRFDAEEKAHLEAKASANAELEGLRAQLAELENQKPAAPVRADENNERMITKMFETNVNVRALPMERRAFEAAYSRAQRREIVKTEEVQTFFAQLREAGKTKAAVTGADLTIPVVFLDLIAENQYRYSKLLNRIRVRNIKGKGRQTISAIAPEAVWTDACAALNEITLVFNQIEVDDFKLGCYVPVCNSILEDSDLELASWIVEMMSESMGKAKDMAIIYGPGVRMPTGFLTSIAASSKPADWPASAPAWEDLHTSNIQSLSASLTGAPFWSALVMATACTRNRYARGERFWAMNSYTHDVLLSKAIAFTMEGDAVSRVFGRLPVIEGDIDIIEDIPDNDIVGGYGQLYLYAQREGATIGADETGRVNRIKDETLFWAKERGDGKPVIRKAFCAINIAGSSVTTTHSFPGDTANNAKLASLSIGETLSPTFDADVTSYTATASNASDTVTAIADDADAQVVVEYNGSQILNGSTVTWATGTKNLVVTVKKGNAVKVYTVAVTKN